MIPTRKQIVPFLFAHYMSSTNDEGWMYYNELAESAAWDMSFDHSHYDVYDPNAEEPETPYQIFYDLAQEIADIWNRE